MKLLVENRSWGSNGSWEIGDEMGVLTRALCAEDEKRQDAAAPSKEPSAAVEAYCAG